MAVAYRAGSTAGSADGGNLTVNAPSGLTDGDILIITLYKESNTYTWTLPEGWAWIISDITNPTFSLDSHVGIAWKRASSEGASWTFNLSGTCWRTAVCGAWSGGIASGDCYDTSASRVAALGENTPIAPSITTGADNAQLTACLANRAGLNIGAGTSGMTQGPELGGVEIFYVIQASAGASGTKTFSDIGAANWLAGHTDILVATGASISVSISTSASISQSPSISQSLSVSPSISGSASESPSISQSRSVSPSISGSQSLSASASPSLGAVVEGSTCWGHDTGVTETNVLNFAGNWIGTGAIENAGDTEALVLNSGEYMDSNVVNMGNINIQILQNSYSAGDTGVIRYRHGATEGDCLSASWNLYTVPFLCLGYVQIRVEIA